MPAEVLTRRISSPLLGRTKRVNIVLPGRYTRHGPGHPVLYLLHGYGGGRDTWLRRTSLLESLGDSRLVVVMPESGRRWFINDHAGMRYEDHFVQELIPMVDAEFNTLADGTARAVGGFSMGGAAALALALRHPGTFGVVASHAGAFEAPLRRGDPYAAYRATPGILMPTEESQERVWGPPGSAVRRRYDPYRLLEEHGHGQRGGGSAEGGRGTGTALALYLDVGTEDFARMIRMNRRMRDALRFHGFQIDYHERSGGHDWDFVDGALPLSLDFVTRHLADADDDTAKEMM